MMVGVRYGIPWWRTAPIFLLASSLVACTTVPSQTLEPSLGDISPPSAWQSPVPWEIARPADHIEKGAWWLLFKDPQLNVLIEQAQKNSPGIASVAARLRQAQAGALAARAGQLPRIDAGMRSTRQKTSVNRPGATYNAQVASTVQNDSVLSASVSYELDIFDRIGSEVAYARANEQQAQADLANARLVLAADLATTYFALRQIDTEIAVVTQSIQLQSRAVDLLQVRRDGGAASGLDLSQQQAQLDTTRTQLELLKRQRPLAVHVLATLSGVPAPSFKLPAQADWNLAAPNIPLIQPSGILQRRPDIAAAQQAVTAANAQIGIARAALYPSLTLSGNSGWESRDFSTLLNGPSLLWSLGASVTQSVFDGGRNRARMTAAEAAQESVSATYQQTVLRAWQEVEDGLSSLDALANAARSAQAALLSANRALDIAQARYTGGLATYLDVVTAQQNLLNNQRQAAQINGQQLAVSAYLVKALGGSWQDRPPEG